MRNKSLAVAAFAAVMSSMPAFAAVELVSPADGESVRLLPSIQKKIMALGTKEERYDALEPERAKEKGKHRDESTTWRRSRPVTLKWRSTEGEKGPWLVRVGTDPEMGKYEEFQIDAQEGKSTKNEDGSKTREWSCTLPSPNFEIGRMYWWKVWSRVRCSHCGTVMIDAKKDCSCGHVKPSVASPTFSFTTEDTPPRWITIEGRVKNMRDLGGWQTEFGRRVRQGIIYRGQGLNDNSKNGIHPGRNRLMVEDRNYLTVKLGIKTDLDLRSGWETAEMTSSPLGPTVKFVHNSSECYGGIFSKHGKKVMAKNFKLFTDEANYPIYFHCIAGADRTGSLAYVLNGICGVSKHDLEVEWEATFYPKLHGVKDDKEKDRDWRGTDWFDEGFAKYGEPDSSLRERIELYLIDCGITKEEIEKVRSIMLEPAAD